MFALLGYPDSNQERQDQNLQCYHYTIPQFLIAGAKVGRFFGTAKLFLIFFHRKPYFSLFSLLARIKQRPTIEKSGIICTSV